MKGPYDVCQNRLKAWGASGDEAWKLQQELQSERGYGLYNNSTLALSRQHNDLDAAEFQKVISHDLIVQNASH